MDENVGFHRVGTIMAALSSSTDAHYGGRWTAIAVHGRGHYDVVHTEDAIELPQQLMR